MAAFSLDEISPPAHRERLARMQRFLERAEGHRQALQKRADEITRVVGTAKGRLEARPRVDAFLSDLQAEANQRSVGAYARLLTGLINDVLGPQAGSAELDLYTSQGLPAL